MSTVPSVVADLRARGEEPTLQAVLATLRVEMPPTLHAGPPPLDPAPPGAAAELLSLGRFQLLGELGRGGMGRVLHARDRELRRDVAVKVIIDPARVPPGQLARFVAEAQITGQLEHPNIVPVHDMGMTPQGEFYFVMKRVEGRSLRAVLDDLAAGDEATRAQWGRHRLLTAFLQMGNAMAYAHDRGVLHRDLKPANVMVGRFGEVLVMDWGLARLLGDRAESRFASTAPGPGAPFPMEGRSRAPYPIEGLGLARTLDGATIGTPGYMSPEQARGDLHLLDGRSDVWSLGAILYELLTLQRAYDGPDIFALLFAAVAGPPPDPRERAPEQRIPEEIAAICLRALALEPAQRFPTAQALVAAVEAFLEGSRRREAAAIYLVAAEGAWERFLALQQEEEQTSARELALLQSIPPWAPLSEKAELLAVRDRRAQLGPLGIRAFTEVQAACEKALSQDPENPDARALLARAHLERFEQAELARDEGALLYHAERVRSHDDGRHAARLEGQGSLTLITSPPGAEVICERFVREGLVWPRTERRSLGPTPLHALPLAMGSYLLTIRAPGFRDTRYPVQITRERHWDSGPIPLFTDADIGEGMVYVPAGPFLYGGDPDAAEAEARQERWLDGFFFDILPPTMTDYCAFVNALHLRDPARARRVLPRQESTDVGGGAPYWELPLPGQPYVVPVRDRDGDLWDPRWPIASVSWDDAVAYAAWKGERDGLAWHLPTELQWEKAVRGVDGRVYPWGDHFDATLCKMRDSRPGRALPEAVGAFATDVSVYGVRDMAGGNRDWCGEDHYSGDRSRRPVRGGSWYSSARLCRVANRVGNEPWCVLSNYGFRLARPAVGAVDADGAPSGPSITDAP